MDQNLKDFKSFLAMHEEGTEIYAFVMNIVEGSESHRPSDTVCFSDDFRSLGLIGVVIAPLLYRWAIDTMNARRSGQELNAAEQRIKLILNLEEDHGYPRDIAEETVDKVLGRIEKHNKEDRPAIEAILKRISSLFDNPE